MSLGSSLKFTKFQKLGESKIQLIKSTSVERVDGECILPCVSNLSRPRGRSPRALTKDVFRRFVTAVFPKNLADDGYADELRILISALTNADEAFDRLVSVESRRFHCSPIPVHRLTRRVN
jgi:hypothetical protein